MGAQAVSNYSNNILHPYSPLKHPITLLVDLSHHIHELHQIHAQMTKTGLIQDPLAASRILDFCASSPTINIKEICSMDYASAVLEQLELRNSFTWNTMIKGYSSSTNPEKAILMYIDMELKDPHLVDNYTFPFVLKSSSELEGIGEGRQIHSQILKHGLNPDIYVYNSLINMYAVCGHVEEARRLFERNIPQFDIVTCNSMLTGFIRAGCLDEAIGLFETMPERNIVSWNTMLSGYIKAGLVERAKELFDQMPERKNSSWKMIIDGYVKQGSMDIARALFDKMPSPDDIAWKMMVEGYLDIGSLECAREIFDQMPQRDLLACNLMIAAYLKQGDTVTARRLFDEMDVRDLVTWNTMISGYSQNRCFQEALDLFREMLVKEIEPDCITFASCLCACANSGAADQGQWIHAQMKRKRHELKSVVATALIDMYSKCGYITKAFDVFNEVSDKDAGMYNSMIVGFSIHSNTKKALQLFDEMVMNSIKPNEITFGAILSACRHAGLVDEGCRFFQLMSSEYDIIPNMKHFGSMVDLLGRAGLLEEAHKFIMNMPIEPDEAIWVSLAGACTKHNDVQIGESVGKKLIELMPNEPSGYVILSNLYAKTERWNDMISVRNMMKKKGLKKLPGCTAIELDGKVHEFVAGDQTYAQSNEIAINLKEMIEV